MITNRKVFKVRSGLLFMVDSTKHTLRTLNVYDLSNPNTFDGIDKNKVKYETEEEISFTPGVRVTLGSLESDAEIKVPHVSARQGVFEYDANDVGGMSTQGLCYTDYGMRKPEVRFNGDAEGVRKNMLYRGERTRVLPGESLIFGNYELEVSPEMD